jgi:hypothetical protein
MATSTNGFYKRMDSMRATAKVELIASERGFALSPYGDYVKPCSAWCGTVTSSPIHEKLVEISKRVLHHVVVDKFEGDVFISEVLV